MRVLVDVNRVVGARLHATLAPDTTGVVEVDDPVGSLEERLRGTDLDARRIGAMVATHNRERPCGVWELSLVDVLDPGTELSYWNLVLRLAGDRACVTSDTGALIDREAISHTRPFLRNPGATNLRRGQASPQRTAS
jgi:hypothetical protein